MKRWIVPMDFHYRGSVIVLAETSKQAILKAEGQDWESDDLKSLVDWGSIGGAEEDK